MSTYFYREKKQGPSSNAFPLKSNPSWTAILSGGTSGGTAIIEIYVSDNKLKWKLVGTMTLNTVNWTSTVDDDSAVLTPDRINKWKFCKAVVKDLTGIDSNVSVTD